jgi:hypothetical protein
MAETDERRVKEAEDQMEATAEEMAERSDELDGQIDSTKQRWEHAKADTSVPTATGDWEDTEPDESTGEDATGFDDPESIDLDDDDLDDDRHPDDDEDY